MTPAEQYKAARELIQQNLLEIADELHEWGKTALLRDGKLREAAKLLVHETFKFQALRMMEDTAYKLMAEHLSGQYRKIVGPPKKKLIKRKKKCAALSTQKTKSTTSS